MSTQVRGGTSSMAWAQDRVVKIADGVYRVVLPLPLDALTAVNIYVLEGDDGLTLIDGGWGVPEARERLDSSLAEIGHSVHDIRNIFVTHAHRDHYSMAASLKEELGCNVLLGGGERGLLAINRDDPTAWDIQSDQLVEAGAEHLAHAWQEWLHAQAKVSDSWAAPSGWLRHDERIAAGGTVIRAVATPGHTNGHYVFIDEQRGLLFSGDHLLPTITPSVGFQPTEHHLPLRDFLESLAAMLELPDLPIMPAHGPTGMSSHLRSRELLAHHEVRLDHTHRAVDGESTAAEVGSRLTWTRRGRALDELVPYNRALAVLETALHLELLEYEGRVTSRVDNRVRYYRQHHPTKE